MFYFLAYDGGRDVRKISGVVAAVAAAVVLAGCGSTEESGTGTPASAGATAAPTTTAPADNGVAALSAEQIIGKAEAALAGARYARIAGSGQEDGSRLRIDMRYGPDLATGTFTVDGQPLTIRRIGQTVYLKGGAAFWADDGADDATVAKLADKYLKVDADDNRFTDLTDFTDLKQAAYDFLQPDGAVGKGNKTNVGGTPAIEVVDKGKEGGTLTVATTGTPYPLTVVSDTDHLTFTAYTTPITAARPPAAQVVDVNSVDLN